MHTAGGTGHVQLALLAEGAHGVPTGQVVTAAWAQPLPSAEQVTTSLPEQYDPLVGLGEVHAATAGQVQSALPAEPAQGLPVGQALLGAEIKQPCVSCEHVTTDEGLSQKVPVVLAQIGGAGGQLQLAEGKLPVQGFWAGHTVAVLR